MQLISGLLTLPHAKFEYWYEAERRRYPITVQLWFENIYRGFREISQHRNTVVSSVYQKKCCTGLVSSKSLP